MTITNSLSPARAQAFHSTMTAQQKHAGRVQFSLPPVQDKTAPTGSSTPAPASGSGGITLLPIAAPSAPASDPATSTVAQSIGSALSTTAANPSHGNAASARLISRLYQGQS